jgi:hypothetical protein
VSTRVPAFALVRPEGVSCPSTHSCEARNCHVFRRLPRASAIRSTSFAFRLCEVRSRHVSPDPCFGRPVCDSLDLVPDPCSKVEAGPAAGPP